MPSTAPSDTPGRPPSRWRVLRHRDFRLLWTAQAISGVGTFMQVVGQSLLVLELSDNSPVALGAVSLAQAAAFFTFSLIGGGVVDRVDKRRVLLVTQTLLLSLAVVLAGLTATNTATLPLVVLLAFLSGTVSSFDQPARSSLFPRLVPRDELSRATTLNALAMTTAGTLGPALAGVTAATLGLTVNFALNAVGFTIVLATLLLIRTDTRPVDVPAKQPLFQSVGEGLKLVTRDPTLPWVVSGYGVLLLLGPSPSVILPLFAAQVLHVDGTHLSLLFLMVGLGTVLASALQAVLSSESRHAGVFLASLLLWASSLVLFSLSTSLVVSALALLLHGAARNVVGTTAVTMMQLLTPEATRGRVMSLNTFLSNGLRPLGDFGVSTAMAATSIQIATATCGILVGLYALKLHRRLPLGNLNAPTPPDSRTRHASPGRHAPTAGRPS